MRCPNAAGVSATARDAARKFRNFAAAQKQRSESTEGRFTPQNVPARVPRVRTIALKRFQAPGMTSFPADSVSGYSGAAGAYVQSTSILVLAALLSLSFTPLVAGGCGTESP